MKILEGGSWSVCIFPLDRAMGLGRQEGGTSRKLLFVLILSTIYRYGTMLLCMKNGVVY